MFIKQKKSECESENGGKKPRMLHLRPVLEADRSYLIMGTKEVIAHCRTNFVSALKNAFDTKDNVQNKENKLEVEVY